jgi:lipoyl(octanoyl) transferase
MYRQKLNNLNIRDCGLIEYRDALKLQHDLRDRRLCDQVPNTVLITEHPPVITLNARKANNKLLIPPTQLTQNKIDLVEIRRGGGATVHNPGQLVFYPIIKISDYKLSINEYVKLLEQIGIDLLKQLNVTAERKKGFIGLWIENRKIASIGVRVSKMVTYHGMAINIKNDLSIFDHIVPCGIDNVQMTSVLKETGSSPKMSEVKKILTDLLTKNFSTQGTNE